MATLTAALLAATGLAALSQPASAAGAPSAAPQDGRAAAAERKVTAQRFLVGYRAGTPAARSDAAARASVANADVPSTKVRLVRRLGTGAVVVDAGTTDPAAGRAVAARLRAQPGVAYVEPDRILRPTLTPNDPRYREQWHYFETAAGIRAPQAWDLSRGAGVTVAVIDTGMTAHPDLPWVAGYDFVSDPFDFDNQPPDTTSNDRDPDPSDAGDGAGQNNVGCPVFSSWHGTHVGGTVKAATNNATGVAGVAFESTLVNVRALGVCGGLLSDITDALVWASGGAVAGAPANPRPADIVNMSLGGTAPCSATFQSAIDGAVSRGATVVVAAGNENQDAAQSEPANCANVVAVAAVDRAGGRASYSNFGAVVDIAAPGGDPSGGGVLSTYNDGDFDPGAPTYAFEMGTSMAAPHVAGATALVLSRFPGLSPAELETTLESTARPFPLPCPEGCGAGIVDPYAALRSLIAPFENRATQPAPFRGIVTAGDFSGDGYPDLVTRTADGVLRLYPGRGTGFAAPAVIGSGWQIFDTILGPGDWNQDGRPDLVARQGGQLFLYPWLGTRFGARSTIGNGWDIFDALAAPGDFDRDGSVDLVARNGGVLYLYLGKPTGFAGYRLIGLGGWESATTLAGVGNFDRDAGGNPDLVARFGDTLRLYRGSRTALGGATTIGTAGWAPFTMIGGPGDFDRDGFTDVVARTSDGRLLLYRGGGTRFIGSRTIGTAGWQVFS